MQFIKTSVLFLLVNIAVMFSIGLVLRVLGLDAQLNQAGMPLMTLLGICLVYGMMGSFISLLLSKVMAKWTMSLQMIDPLTATGREREVLETVHELSRAAGLRVMPDVGIYQSGDMNAFATGPSRNSSLVAVSTGLLNRMDSKQVRGVLGHEVAHIANGDMVTMSLMYGVVNAFALFFAMILARIIAAALTPRDQEGRSNSGLAIMIEFIVRSILQYVFMIFGQIIISWFSRVREYRADAGGARFAGKQNMISALQGLMTQQMQPPIKEESSDQFAAFKISTRSGFLSLFATHPPLEDRIERLRSSKSEV